MSDQVLNARPQNQRIYIRGKLVLDTPAHLGCGEAGTFIDMPLQTDPLTGKALLTGASLAGALKNHLRIVGLDQEAESLFGQVIEGENGTSFESWLVVEDAISSDFQVETRDGVSIRSDTRTAEDKKKYDFDLLQAGTTFDIGFELILPSKDSPFLPYLVTALLALQEGKILIGKRKRRGFGKCHVENWNVWKCEPGSNVDVLLAWLETWPLPEKSKDSGTDIVHLLGPGAAAAVNDSWCHLEADFTLASPILIRSTAQKEAVAGSPSRLPDFQHLHSRRGKSLQPIISGTSLAGILRARTVQIANTLGFKGVEKANALFGLSPTRRPPGQQGQPKNKTWVASRVWVEESVIQFGEEGKPVGEETFVQSRVMIDRFTGGAHEGALFSEQPVFPHRQACVHLAIHLDVRREWEIGLLMLLLKDLWTGDLRIGGESSVGRGRLKGTRAVLRYKDQEWEWIQAGQGIHFVKGEPQSLQAYLDQSWE